LVVLLKFENAVIVSSAINKLKMNIGGYDDRLEYRALRCLKSPEHFMSQEHLTIKVYLNIK